MLVIAQMNAAAAFRWTCFNLSVQILLAMNIPVLDQPRSVVSSQRETHSIPCATMSTGARFNNCEAVTVKPKTGLARLSLISPARVISFATRVLIEFGLQARSDEGTDGDNGSIIEGCIELYNMDATESFVKKNRVYGERCALDIKYMVLINALEACIEVKVLSLGVTPGGIDMKLCAKSSGFKEVIRLFEGAAPDPGETMSFIVAAENRSVFDLYIEGSARDDQKLLPLSWRCSFTAGYHVMNENVAKLGELATVSVKVTWRTHMKKALS